MSDRARDRRPSTVDGLTDWVSEVEARRRETDALPENAYGLWLCSPREVEPGDGDLDCRLCHIAEGGAEGTVVECPISKRQYEVVETTLGGLWAHLTSDLYCTIPDMEPPNRREKLRKHVIDAFLSEVAPANVDDVIRHGAHFIASNAPSPGEELGRVEPTTFEDEVAALVPIAREWLTAHGFDPSLLG